jgi:hypothetical protein
LDRFPFCDPSRRDHYRTMISRQPEVLLQKSQQVSSLQIFITAEKFLDQFLSTFWTPLHSKNTGKVNLTIVK